MPFLVPLLVWYAYTHTTFEMIGLGVLVALWAFACSFPAQAARLSHSHLHDGRHLSLRTNDISFSGIPMFANGSLSDFGLSSSCEQALYQNIYCDDAVSYMSTNSYVGSFDNSTLTALVCDPGCEASISELHDAVAVNCGTSAAYVAGLPYLALVDQLWSNWNRTCFTDPITGGNCNGEKCDSVGICNH